MNGSLRRDAKITVAKTGSPPLKGRGIELHPYPQSEFFTEVANEWKHFVLLRRKCFFGSVVLARKQCTAFFGDALGP